jgi:hypothetical protein
MEADEIELIDEEMSADEQEMFRGDPSRSLYKSLAPDFTKRPAQILSPRH